MNEIEHNETYPWSVQPRVIDGKTMWVAFDASTDYESNAYHTFKGAADLVSGFVLAEKMTAAAESRRAATRTKVMTSEKAKRARPEYPTETV